DDLRLVAVERSDQVLKPFRASVDQLAALPAQRWCRAPVEQVDQDSGVEGYDHPVPPFPCRSSRRALTGSGTSRHRLPSTRCNEVTTASRSASSSTSKLSILKLFKSQAPVASRNHVPV